ncbi:MAG: hypothetical protein Q8R48_03805, partial [Candidatus Omnitrophota bacterium]|nr:hypothetical protein [Candidatus Omnitrophota bacterium]
GGAGALAAWNWQWPAPGGSFTVALGEDYEGSALRASTRIGTNWDGGIYMTRTWYNNYERPERAITKGIDGNGEIYVEVLEYDNSGSGMLVRTFKAYGAYTLGWEDSLNNPDWYPNSDGTQGASNPGRVTVTSYAAGLRFLAITGSPTSYTAYNNSGEFIEYAYYAEDGYDGLDYTQTWGYPAEGGSYEVMSEYADDAVDDIITYSEAHNYDADGNELWAAYIHYFVILTNYAPTGIPADIQIDLPDGASSGVIGLLAGTPDYIEIVGSDYTSKTYFENGIAVAAEVERTVAIDKDGDGDEDAYTTTDYYDINESGGLDFPYMSVASDGTEIYFEYNTNGKLSYTR